MGVKAVTLKPVGDMSVPERRSKCRWQSHFYVFIVFYCVAYSLFFFFYNFLMAFVRLLLNSSLSLFHMDSRPTDLLNFIAGRFG